MCIIFQKVAFLQIFRNLLLLSVVGLQSTDCNATKNGVPERGL